MFECEPSCRYCQRNNSVAISRFMKFVRKTNSCWEWAGTKDPNGYAKFGYMGKTWFAHRFSKAMVEPLLEGREIDHLCRNRGCVNPEHLEQVSHRTNIHRSPIHPMSHLNPYRKAGSRSSQCRYGHKKSSTPSGRWVCLACASKRTIKARQKKQEHYREYARNYYRLHYAKTVYKD